MRISDWSSDVCSSDLARAEQRGRCQGDWGAGPGDPALDRHHHTPATGAFAGPASRRPCTHRYNAGNTRRVSKVEEMTPPITTVPKGPCPSAPPPALNAIGTNPMLATSAAHPTGPRPGTGSGAG